MPFAAAISEHPVTAHAVGEVVGQLLETQPGPIELAFLFVTAPHAGALEDAARAVEATLAPGVLLGCAAESVAGPRREVEATAAVALWTASSFPAEAVAAEPSGRLRIGNGNADPEFAPEALLVLADPFSTDVSSMLASVQDRYPGLPVIGGLASGARGPGGSRLALGERITTAGAVGALVGGGSGVSALVSQGCRPIGRPWAVTRAEGNVVYELAGRPALGRLMDLAAEELDDLDVALVNRGGLHLGIVMDEHKADFGPGDFLIRNVLGADRAAGAIAVDVEVAVGTTVQYQLRDASAADHELRSLAAERRAQAALLFTCNGRGTRLFRRPHHDATVLADLWGDPPLAGMFAAGEIGPVGGRNFLHGFTASVALFDPERRG